MKRTFFYVSILLVATSFYSCSRVDIQNISYGIINRNSIVMTKSLGETVENQDFDVTLQMAELFIRSDKTNPGVIRIEPYIVDDYTCFYIFNFEKGFKIVSADTRIVPVLAESYEENLYLDQVHDGLKVWLQDTGDKIKQVKKNSINTSEDYSGFWAAYKCESIELPQTKSWPTNPSHIWIKHLNYSSSISSFNAHILPLLPTKWGQGYPWNVNMPTINGEHCLTGCAAVAVSQVLYYYYFINHIPNDFWNSIAISSFNSDYTVTLNKTNYTVNSSRWYFMPLYADPYYYAFVSDLMLDMGERLRMHYGVSNSFITHNSDYSIPYLSQCGISSSHAGYSFPAVVASLVSGRPVIVSAWSNPAPYYGVGHTWVIDGCDDYVLKTTITETYNYIPTEDLGLYPDQVGVYTDEQMHMMYPFPIDGMQIANTSYSSVRWLRMNWGYDGEGDDAYYGVLDTSDWNSLDNPNFLYSRHIHYNITANQIQ